MMVPFWDECEAPNEGVKVVCLCCGDEVERSQLLRGKAVCCMCEGRFAGSVGSGGKVEDAGLAESRRRAFEEHVFVEFMRKFFRRMRD